MKELIQNNKLRHVIRMMFAVIIACLCNYYAAFTQEGWLILTTIVVMLTSTGSALYQGLLRFFLLIGLVTFFTLTFSSVALLFLRLSDITLGAFIGIFINVIILSDRIATEFRQIIKEVLHAYAKYFASIVELLLLRQTKHAEEANDLVLKRLQQLPGWVYEVGFDITLQKSYRYFVRKMNQISETLFAMHYIVHYPFE